MTRKFLTEFQSPLWIDAWKDGLHLFQASVPHETADSSLHA